jgi:hypothetical protein
MEPKGLETCMICPTAQCAEPHSAAPKLNIV